VDTESHELIAGYALDALDDADRARAEALLASSEEARDELRAYSDVATAMATAAAGPAPPPELRQRVLDAVHDEPQNVVSLDERRRSRAVPVLAVAAALAACAAIAAGVWGASVSSDLDDTRAALAQQRAAATVLADPDAESVALESGDGRLVVGGEGSAVLVLDSLGPAPPGKTYELWVSAGGAPVPAGLFGGGGERDVVPVEQRVEPGSVVLVTVEDAGGVDAPTSDPIVASQPV
jgi:anti-sigma-K factor RskA